jgi:hypothetical protein
MSFTKTHAAVLLVLVAVPVLLIVAANAGNTNHGQGPATASSTPSPVPAANRTLTVIDGGLAYMDVPTLDPGKPTWTPEPTAVAQKRMLGLYISLTTRPGTVVAEWTSSKPITSTFPEGVGIKSLSGYRIEEVPLSERPTFIVKGNELDFQGTPITVDKVWRLTVNGDFSNIGTALSYSVCSNNIILGRTDYVGDRRVSVIAFDRALLPEGGTITVRYGERCDQSPELPAKIHYTS